MYATEWTNQIWESDLPKNAKFIAVYLRRFLHGDKRTCYPSKSRMIKETGMGKKTINAALKLLQHEGYISISVSRGGSSNRYTIQLVSNDTSVISTPNRVKTNLVNGVKVTPQKSNIKKQIKKVNNFDAFDRLQDKSWSEGLI